jgi:hypothetical protein
MPDMIAPIRAIVSVATIRRSRRAERASASARFPCSIASFFVLFRLKATRLRQRLRLFEFATTLFFLRVARLIDGCATGDHQIEQGFVESQVGGLSAVQPAFGFCQLHLVEQTRRAAAEPYPFRRFCFQAPTCCDGCAFVFEPANQRGPVAHKRFVGDFHLRAAGGIARGKPHQACSDQAFEHPINAITRLARRGIVDRVECDCW